MVSRPQVLNASIVVVLVVAANAALAQAQVVLAPGNFTYQFTDGNGVPHTAPVTLAAIGDSFPLLVYLVQTGGTPTINELGVQRAGVRLNYPGGIVRVPIPAAANIFGNSEFDRVDRVGSGTSFDTSTSAYLQDSLVSPFVMLPYPQDTGDSMRILIGQFRIQALAIGTTQIQAVDPFPGTGGNNLTGPNPPSGTGTWQGPGAIDLDPFLAENLPVPVIPTLTIQVGVVPEPSVLALAGCGMAGLALLRRSLRTAVA